MTRPFRLVVNEPLQANMDRETVEALRRVVKEKESGNDALVAALLGVTNGQGCWCSTMGMKDGRLQHSVPCLDVQAALKAAKGE